MLLKLKVDITTSRYLLFPFNDYLQTVRIGLAKEETQKRCVHFYACICAFASDEKLSDEFSYYINLDDSLGESISDLNESM